LTGLAVALLALIVYFFTKLYIEANPVFAHTGFFSFIFQNNWNPAANIYGGWPLVVGTLITSAVALILGVPVAVAAALFVTELCPRRIRTPAAIVIDLLAAVPSVVYGLWGIFVVIPALRPIEHTVGGALSFLPFFSGVVPGPNYFVAGLILVLMIVPIISGISREVMATVPPEDKEAALALGASRWEMIRMAVLPYSRAGIAGATMLGLGRALGETIAVQLLIGDSLTVGHHLFDQGYSLAAVIANEFNETTSGSLHQSALIAAGLVLFVLTLGVNIVARYFVVRGARHQRRGGRDMVATEEAATLGGVA
jgi:phosphate ABC transporter permease protein PstC